MTTNFIPKIYKKNLPLKLFGWEIFLAEKVFVGKHVYIIIIFHIINYIFLLLYELDINNITNIFISKPIFKIKI